MKNHRRYVHDEGTDRHRLLWTMLELRLLENPWSEPRVLLETVRKPAVAAPALEVGDDESHGCR